MFNWLGPADTTMLPIISSAITQISSRIFIGWFGFHSHTAPGSLDSAVPPGGSTPRRGTFPFRGHHRPAHQRKHALRYAEAVY